MKQKKDKEPFFSSSIFRKASLSSLAGITFLCCLWLAHAITEIRLPQSDHPAELYSNQTQDDLRRTLTTAMHNAKKSILLVIYALTDPHIINTLKQKAEEGINVMVVYDAKASQNVHRKLGPKVKIIRRFSPGLMHQKILVVDDSQTWIGSANMTTESLRMHGNLLVAMDHKAVAKAVTARAKALPSKGKASPTPPQEFLLGPQKAELWFLPDNPEALFRLLQLIRTAQKTIRVAMFTWTHSLLTEEIANARKRGVDVQVVIDHNSGKGVSAQTVQHLTESDVAVSLSHPSTLLHHKFLYIDGNTLVNGSTNWTKAAFTQNDDCFMILHSLTEEQHQRLEKLWKIISTEATKIQ